MALMLSRPVGIVRGSARPSWMPNPTNDVNDLRKVLALLQLIPNREGGRLEDWGTLGSGPPFTIDPKGGVCPPELADAIFTFQDLWNKQGAVHIVDGVVDPGGHTLAKMNALVAALGAAVGGMSNVPPEGQLDTMACWAAGLAWLTRATPGGKPTAQLTIITANAGKFGTSGSITESDLLTADAAGVLLQRKSIVAPQLELTVGAGVFPLLVAFTSGPMSGHVNVIHGFNAAKSEIDAMEPWFPDPSKNADFDLISTGARLSLRIKALARRLFSRERMCGDYYFIIPVAHFPRGNLPQPFQRRSVFPLGCDQRDDPSML